MRLLLVGDVHGNTSWVLNTVMPVAREHRVDAVAALGDFGWWPHLAHHVRAVAAAASSAGIEWWWLDGNHEHHPSLHARLRGADLSRPVPLDGLVYLPRGCRLDVDGASVLALGGAVSIDAQLRVAGFDHFAEETITDVELARACAAGPVAVVLSHDAPDGYEIPRLDPDPPRSWLAMRPAAEAHRARVGEVVRAVSPQLVVHAHYHLRYSAELDIDGRTCAIEGLSRDGAPGGLALLDIGAGQISFTDVAPRRVTAPRVRHMVR